MRRASRRRAQCWPAAHVVVLDAPPTIGNNIQRAVDEIAAANGVSNKVNYLVYSRGVQGFCRKSD